MKLKVVRDLSGPESTGTVRGGLSLRSNVSWALIGNVVNAGSHWAMLAILAKLGSTEAVGQFALGLALGAPVMMLMRLQLRHIQATDASGEHPFEDYFLTRAIGTLVALVVTIALAYLSGFSFAVRSIAIALGFQKAFESMSDIHYGEMQRRERMDLVARSLIVKGLAALLVLGIVFRLTGSVLWAAVSLSCIYLGVWLLYDYRHSVSSASQLLTQLGTRPRRVLSLARLALPLGIVTMLVTLDRNMPRYILGYAMDETAVGIFSALAYIPVVGSTVTTAIGQSVGPRVAQLWRERKIEAFRNFLTRLTFLAIALGLAAVGMAVLFGQPIIRLLYSAEYAAHSHILAWLMAAAVFSYATSFLEVGLTAVRALKSQAAATAFGTLATGIACATLIPDLGLLGAAYASIAGASIRMALCGLLLDRATTKRVSATVTTH